MLSIYSCGAGLGTLAGYMMGGWVDQHYGWRAVFLIAGAPGLAVALLLFLTAIFTGGGFGGSIPAILMNIPGTSSSIATSFDGYPMSRKGQHNAALDRQLTIAARRGDLAQVKAILAKGGKVSLAS